MTELSAANATLRSTEAGLDRAAHPLDLHTDTDFRETLRIVGRGISYIKYFKVRFLLRAAIFWLTLMSPLILPWPIKIVIDNVILGLPIGEGTVYPPYFVPFVEFLDGRTAVEMMAWVAALAASWVVLFGAFGTGHAQAYAEGNLAEGHDTATQTENEANEAFSKVSGLIGLIEFRLVIRLTQALNHLIRVQLFQRINSLSMKELNDQRIGDSVYRIMYDTPALTNVFYQAVLSPISAVWTFCVTLAVMSYSYGDAPELVWLVFLMLPLQTAAMIPFSRPMRRRSQASRAAGSVTTGNIEEGMSNVLAVQSLGGNTRERQRFDSHSGESFRRFRGQVLVRVLMGVASRAAGGLLGLLAFYLISSRVIEGMLTPGDYGVLLFYYAWLAGSLTALPYAWFRIQESIPGIRRVFFVLDLPNEITRGGTDLPAIQEGIEFRNVGYTYTDGRKALNRIDLTARVGEIVALVGPTGAGKTTLAYLIPGYYEPTDGKLLVDGVELGEISLASLRQQVSYVFQETQLFSDSILDNIRYGNRDATLADVERVARIAGAHDFITSLPNGYDTGLGTVTSKLSVGQKQRIAIARGLLKDASILILDEPTSALDPETEAYLVDALREAAKEKLVIIIAHRLSTVTHADKIIFLQEGEILQQGSHEELMADAESAYREYVMLQGADLSTEREDETDNGP
jgi:ABC-type multidrug transport system fused ATPase/permease subunit|tara:strand:+ start:4288 stop:6345 length:2058 start_codon:yes stop_codon:yes gene_type:complete